MNLAIFGRYQLSQIFVEQIGMEMFRVSQICMCFPRIIRHIISKPSDLEFDLFSSFDVASMV